MFFSCKSEYKHVIINKWIYNRFCSKLKICNIFYRLCIQTAGHKRHSWCYAVSSDPYRGMLQSVGDGLSQGLSVLALIHRRRYNLRVDGLLGLSLPGLFIIHNLFTIVSDCFGILFSFVWSPFIFRLNVATTVVNGDSLVTIGNSIVISLGLQPLLQIVIGEEYDFGQTCTNRIYEL